MEIPSSNQLTLSHDEIAARAYLVWERNGRCHGFALDHWLEAETQLMKELAEKVSEVLVPEVAAPPCRARLAGSRYGLVLNPNIQGSLVTA